MKYLITGGAGFIGSHLVDALLREGHSIRILDDFSTGSTKNLLRSIENQDFEVISGSILDREIVERAFEEIDGCFHMAAAVGVEKIINDPIGSLKTNIHGTENILETATSGDVPVLLASTSEIYGKNSGGPLSEESDRIIGSPLLSRWTYSEAKALDESLARALYEARGLRVKIIRYFNTVGPRQSAAYGMVIPRFFEAAMRNDDLVVHGNGSQKRIFCHIDDAIDGTLELWKSDSGFGEAFNLGGFEEIDILSLAHKIIEICNSSSNIEFISYEDLRKTGFEDMQRRIPDTSKLKRSTGWTPKKNLDDILSDYHEYLRDE